MHSYFNAYISDYLLYNQNMKTFLLCGLCCLLAFPSFAENDHVRIAQQNAPAVVTINAIKKDGSTFTGTGFVLTSDGLIATSRHVSQDTLFMNITFNNGAVSGEAVTAAEAGNVDLSLLRIHARNLPTVKVASSSHVMPGQSITVIGNPRRLQNTVTSGLISQVRKKSDGVIWHQISAPISPSSSGSPVFNANGEVISVAFASYPGENNQNLNFSIPSDYLINLVQAAGFHLPQEEDISTPPPAPVEQDNAFVAHIKKSWSILKRILHINS